MFTSGVYQLELLVRMAVDMKVCEADIFLIICVLRKRQVHGSQVSHGSLIL